MGQDLSQLGAALDAAKSSMNFDGSSVELTDARSLPMEDAIWVISIVDDPKEHNNESNVNEDCAHLRLMAIVDENGLFIGSSAKDERQLTEDQQALDLLKQCIFAPMVWKPRRPRYFGFRNDVFFTTLPLEEHGMQKISMFTGAYGPDTLPRELQIRRACSRCQKRGSVQLFETCSKCEALYYCTDACRRLDYDHERDIHGHGRWCSKMKQYKETADELAQLPFTFIKETTDSDFTDLKLKVFLSKLGVLNHGAWRWEHFEDEMPGFGGLKSEEHPVGLPSEGATLDSSPDQPAPPMSGWSDYYKWRGFGLESPVAILLQWPLTIYRIITEHVPKDYPDLRLDLEDLQPVILHLIGVEKEADMTSLFSELAHLIPDKSLHIVMIGTHISSKVHNKEQQVHPRVKVTLWKGLYHQYTAQPPQLVIGLNAGLAAYATWVDTLKKLKSLGVPTYFTDYCQYSCECAKSPVEYLKLGTASSHSVNPFRSPVRKYCEEHCMPWYSNGFIYRLIYNT